jgi:hypothetical protein
LNSAPAAGLPRVDADCVGGGRRGGSKRKCVPVRDMVRYAEVSAQSRARDLRPDQACFQSGVGAGRVNRSHGSESRRRECEVDMHNALPLQRPIVCGRVADLRAAGKTESQRQRQRRTAHERSLWIVPLLSVPGRCAATSGRSEAEGRVRICESVEQEDRPTGLRPQRLQARVPTPLETNRGPGVRGWLKVKNPNYWRRDDEREALARSRERRRRTRV